MIVGRQPWIHSVRVDGLFILGPSFAATALALWIVSSGNGHAGVSLWNWLLLVVGIDVAHVYSTVYRTYFDPQERRKLNGWLVATPLASWIVGVLLYALSASVFWTALAYTAVFHFVRQQYGLVMLYARAERSLPAWCRLVDQLAIYGATVFPLLFWHTHLPRPFDWFIEGDFLSLPRAIWSFAAPIYAFVMLSYIAKEAWLIHRARQVNLPRNAIVLGTAMAWYVGIVLSSGDLVFTLTNVVSHGIPYIALICIFSRRRELQTQRPKPRFLPRALPATLGLLVLFAFLEEGLWDGLVWREHLALFPGFSLLPAIDSSKALSLLVPLLAVPQMTHYVLDGVIWRLRAHPEWRATLFWRPAPLEAS